MQKILCAAACAASMIGPALAQDLKIGVVVPLSGPPAVLGKQVEDAFRLAVEDMNGEVGGVSTEVFVVDSELKPEVALTRVKGLLERDEVDFVVGTVFSNVLGAIVKPVTKSETFLISPNAGPSTLAGRNCNPFFFSTSYQNNQNFEVLGKHAQDQGIKSVFMMTPNYQAGRDAVEGFKKFYEGEITNEVYTPLGHQDFSAEIAEMSEAGAEALFTFMPGGMGVRFVKQYRESGLADKMTFLSAFTVDEATLPAQQDAALGFFGATSWAPSLDLPRSQEFVARFEEKYGYIPGGFAMQAYDAALLIDSAVRAVGGNLEDKDALREALEAADFESLRGNFAFNNNHFPIQDFYLLRVAQREDGKFWTEVESKVFEDYSDSFAQDCKMK
ncbi:ABC transporter substrate-binding protein [uncultured Ruegeria sp.]|uniref:ABC transporter substrate-binding protein n=1 Tax=uncultured Ruegeria sp. TaxID=259304 RepID=UPI002607C174|nr:ABC transporter substrate-binding protein [uncultured Ruegeria sp.]